MLAPGLPERGLGSPGTRLFHATWREAPLFLLQLHASLSDCSPSFQLFFCAYHFLHLHIPVPVLPSIAFSLLDAARDCAVFRPSVFSSTQGWKCVTALFCLPFGHEGAQQAHLACSFGGVWPLLCDRMTFQGASTLPQQRPPRAHDSCPQGPCCAPWSCVSGTRGAGQATGHCPQLRGQLSTAPP